MAPRKPKKSAASSTAIERRHFLGLAAAAGPAMGLAALNPISAQAAEAAAPAAKSAVPERSPEARETEAPTGPIRTVSYPGSDFMIDVIKTLNFEYVAAVPGSSFRGLQESLVNYGNNTAPQWVTCLHEDSSVAVAHGYAKMSGKPMLCLVHGVVGLAHAPMAIYNAYADQVPIVIIAGNTADEGERRPNADWQHSAHDQAIMVRDMTKWDDQPYSMQGFSESLVRAYDIATSAPCAPVLIVANGELMEEELPPEERKRLTIPALKERSFPAGDPNAVREAAKWLVAAENPLIIADRYCRTQNGMDMLVKLAETLHAPVVDKLTRLNMPNHHPLCHTAGGGAALRQADVVLLLEPADPFGTLNDVPDIVGAHVESKHKAGAKIISIGTGQAGLTKSNFNTFMRYQIADLTIPADGESTMPSLIEAIQVEMNGNAKSRAEARGEKLVAQAPRFRDAARAGAAYGWDASPISTPRLSAELWDAIKGEPDWAAGALSAGLSGWPDRLWNFDKRYQAIGGQGGGGLGYSSPAAVGAALANKKLGRLTVAVVGDGDYNMAPGVMWTAAQQKLPLLMIVQNNGGYYQEIMHIQRMADQRSRGIQNGSFGCTFNDPMPNYAAIAKGYGCYAEGPISDPKELGPAIRRALAQVKRGQPALLDVVSQAR